MRVGVTTITTCKRPNLFSDCPLMNLWLENHSAARHHHFVQINSQFVAFLHLRERERERVSWFMSIYPCGLCIPLPALQRRATCIALWAISILPRNVALIPNRCWQDDEQKRWRRGPSRYRWPPWPCLLGMIGQGEEQPPITNTTPQVSNVGYWSNMPVLTMCQADNNRNELKP